MDLLKRAASAVCGVVPAVLNLVRNRVLGVWDEVATGHHRLDWWLLLALVWLDGLACGWWLWVR
jgi:phage-related protein